MRLSVSARAATIAQVSSAEALSTTHNSNCAYDWLSTERRQASMHSALFQVTMESVTSAWGEVLSVPGDWVVAMTSGAEAVTMAVEELKKQVGPTAST